MTRAFLCGLLLIAGLPFAVAQSGGDESQYGITFSGFVRTDFIYDTRQNVTAREGIFLLWPSAPSYDINGADINALPNFNILSVMSRLTGTITGPDAFGARTSGVIEIDFFGTTNAYLGLLRMRHAYLKMTWNDNTELLIGQHWNPMFIAANYPTTVSINSGTPFNAFARNPQLRLTVNRGSLRIIAAALSQRDFSSVASADGITATASPDYLRNSSVPDMHLQLHYRGSTIMAGAGVAWKTIMPRKENPYISPIIPYDTIGRVKTNASVRGLSALAFAKITTSPVTVKLYTRYGENLNDIINPGGYGVTAETEPGGFVETYSPLRNMSYWTDISTNGGNIQAGLFGGFLKNHGSATPLAGADPKVFGRAIDLDRLIRVSPRIVFKSGKLQIASEAEITKAWHGDGTINTDGTPNNATPVTNVRFITNFTYTF